VRIMMVVFTITPAHLTSTSSTYKICKNEIISFHLKRIISINIKEHINKEKIKTFLRFLNLMFILILL
jgi:hypothetical protein